MTLGEQPVAVRAARTKRGSTVAGYRLVARLRRVGRGVVWDAVEEESGRHVHLRLVDFAGDEAFAERFLKDGQRLADLKAPGLPRVHAVGQDPEVVYLATAPVEGTTVGKLVRNGGPLAPERALSVLGDVGQALDAAHAAGLVHRGVGPDTVVVADGGGEHAFLVDFALGVEPTNPIVGGRAPYYPAPESTRGKDANPKSDIYSFACLLFQCLTGAPPFGAERGDRSAPSVSARRPELPAALDHPLQRGMAESPADRPASAGELLAQVRRELLPDRPRSERPPRDMTRPAEPGALVPMRNEAMPARMVPMPPRAVTARKSIKLPAMGGWVGVLALAATLIVAAGVGGYLAGRSGDGDGGDVAKTKGSKDLELALPAGWHEEPPRSLDGLPLDQPAAAEALVGGTGIVVGLAGRSSFATRVAERVDGSAGRPAVVTLGDLEAYRWRGLRERRTRQHLTLFLAPTDAGLAAAACFGDRPGALARCERAAGSLAVDAEPVPVGTFASYAQRLDRTIRHVQQRRATYRRRLQLASTPGGQARAASALARTHRSAAASLQELSPPSAAEPARAAVIASLRRVSDAYAGLSRAARAHGPGGYRRGRRTVNGTERALRRAVARL
jgi:protein kinase-like protein